MLVQIARNEKCLTLEYENSNFVSAEIGILFGNIANVKCFVRFNQVLNPINFI